jgi:glycosyltransferase involved in cell wall biosynthesis
MFNYPKLNLVFDTPNSKLLELYHSHDIFVHPTMLEAGHPNLTMVEAAAAGLPLIANWEYETLFHGAWRSPRDVFEMERGLDDIMENFDFYRQRAINTGLELDWKNRTKELLTIYKKYAI